MRTVSDLTRDVLTGSRQVTSYVSAYYDGTPVLDELPIVDGTLTIDNTQAVPGDLSLTLPRYYTLPDTGAVVDLLPADANAPLGAEGTQLAVSYTIAVPGHDPETINLGWYRIQSWEETDEATISVSAASLEALIQEARFFKAQTVAKGTTYAAAYTKLLGGLLPLVITADDTTKTGKQTFEEDRLEALTALVTAWPARQYVDDDGVLNVTPALADATDPIVVSLTDGVDGTIVKAPRHGDRDGVYNAVKASGEADGDVAPVSATVYLRDGSRRWNGPFGNVPYFYSSSLLTTKDQAKKAAQTTLDRLQHIANPITIETAPDPRIQEGDIIAVTTSDRGRLVVRVDGLTFPLTYAATMTITGHVIDGRTS